MGTKYSLLILVIYFCNIGNQCVAKIINCGLGFYLAENMTCIDDNECGEVKATASALCGVNTECYNTFGSFYCTCKAGYFNHAGKTNFTSRTNCHDINECLTNPCGPNLTCTNVPGDYYCTCKEGFVFINQTKLQCQDVNECLNAEEACGPNASCNNTAGGFYCTCNGGFVSTTGEPAFTNKVKTQCQDVDECLNEVEPCGPNASCNNTAGGFNCTCNGGFVSTTGEPAFTNKTQTQCQDVDECLNEVEPCGPNASCNNTAGGFNCTCNGGFVSTTGELTFTNKTQTQCQDLISFRPQTSSLQDIDLFAIQSFTSLSKLNNTNSKEFHKLVSNFLEVMEDNVLTAAHNLHHKEIMNFSSDGFDVVSQAIQNNTIPEDERSKLTTTKNSLDIGWNSVAGKESFDVAAVVFIAYKQLDSLMEANFLDSSNKETKLQLISEVVTAAVTNKDTKKLNESVILTFKNKKLNNEKAKCVYWDSSAFVWSARGCKVDKFNTTHTVCNCTHLSSFAVLMALHEIEKSDEYNLSVITMVGIILSLVCLFISILTFILCRSIKGIRTVIHTHLSVSLFLAELLFLIGISRTENKIVCAVVAGFLHYLFLACFTWMLLEGIQLYLMVVKVFNAKSLRPKYMCLFGYGFPLLVVGISAIAYPYGYGTENYCWLDLKSRFLWAFLAPVCVVIVVNAGFFIITVLRLVDKFSSLNPDMDNLKKIRAFTFTAVAQLCLLGCTWIFGMLHFQKETIAMAYIFTIVNSLQGAFIFILHCLFNKQVRDEYTKIFIGVCNLKKASKYSEFSTSSTQGLKSTHETGM
ncbi:adhesion G protein-coupled receptor E3-like isoform X3 [Heterodontus francisci]|uniref:adhesion G protein-coupled receptor E3-like isoform X3 n=1 Tax=Heterodontus francisci TaxID=7792 RepID=UPI00355B7A54